MSYHHHHNDDLIPASFHSNQAGHRSRTDNQSGAHPNVIFGVTFKGPTRLGWIMFLLSRDVDVAFCGFLSHFSMALNNSATFNSWATLNSGGLAFGIISRNSSQHEICYLAVKIEEEKKNHEWPWAFRANKALLVSRILQRSKLKHSLVVPTNNRSDSKIRSLRLVPRRADVLARKASLHYATLVGALPYIVALINRKYCY